MKRCPLVSVGVLAALLTAAVPAAAAPPAPAVSPAPPRAQLVGFTCTRAPDPAGRAVSVQAVMRPLPGTARMQIRFELVVAAAPGHPAHTVPGGDLGTWLSPETPTLGQLPGDVWRLNKSVLGLAAPAAYRLLVTFRWRGGGGAVLGVARRVSPTCAERGLRAGGRRRDEARQLD